jgi:hypothetical protein
MVSRTEFQILLAYFLGIAADSLWAAAFLLTPVWTVLTGETAVIQDPVARRVMSVAGVLMMGWTCLLVWAVQDPIQRRVVALLTAVPVITGLICISVSAVLLRGDTSLVWIVGKTTLLLAAFLRSYQLAERVARKRA